MYSIKALRTKKKWIGTVFAICDDSFLVLFYLIVLIKIFYKIVAAGFSYYSFSFHGIVFFVGART